MTEVNSLSIIDQGDMVSFKKTIEKIAQWQHLVQTNLKEGKDYGTIPGTSKPTLYKSGAEKIIMLGKLRSTFEILDETKDWENEFFQFEIRWDLWVGDNIIAQGVGLCSSKEDKYRYRWVNENRLPNNISKDNLPCRVKSGKYGEYKQYRVENEDICSIANTILKMAKKRAEIDAALLVGSLSELFTQDVEDLPAEYLGNDKPAQKPKSKPTPAKKEPEPTNNDLATQPQKDKIYGTVVCEKCGTRVYGFKCPICKNADNVNIATKGFIHSHLLVKEDFKKEMKPVLLPDELTKIDAMIIWDWWLGDSKNIIVGERIKRESKEKEAKPEATKEEKIAQARHIASGGKLELREGKKGLLNDDEEEPGSSYNNPIKFKGKKKKISQTEDFIAPEDLPE